MEKKRKLSIMVIIVIVIAIIGTGMRAVNKPIKAFKEAIEIKDYEKASFNYRFRIANNQLKEKNIQKYFDSGKSPISKEEYVNFFIEKDIEKLVDLTLSYKKLMSEFSNRSNWYQEKPVITKIATNEIGFIADNSYSLSNIDAEENIAGIEFLPEYYEEIKNYADYIRYEVESDILMMIEISYFPGNDVSLSTWENIINSALKNIEKIEPNLDKFLKKYD